ncbi:MAG: hypothetical protein EA381_12815 [Planctomycetaceae bacterium]|nr:MAG: hypothetical protein EA381_12815 [Planctomycetaceae bacterium]
MANPGLQKIVGEPAVKRSTFRIAIASLLSFASLVVIVSPLAADAPASPAAPRIDSVVISVPQPQAVSPAVIWFDDFDDEPLAYTESDGPNVDAEAFGGSGRSMLSHYPQEGRGVGNRKVFFGDSPTGKVVRRGETFTDVYWRIYIKHQAGWTGGGPAKLSRATSMVSPNWAQAMIAHVWSSGEALTLDPASGVRDGRIVTTRYNDFANLRWLGNRPASNFPLHSTQESGRWVCVEARAKLNTPGELDGLNQLWIDGRLEAERQNLDWRGDYDGHGINAVFLESYWNDGSPVTQSRWIDNFVISTEPIGPVVCPRNPELIRTPPAEADGATSWQVEVATFAEPQRLVWRSSPITSGDRVRVDAESGQFVDGQAARNSLDPDRLYHFRIRQTAGNGRTSAWSPWHQTVRTAAE